VVAGIVLVVLTVGIVALMASALDTLWALVLVAVLGFVGSRLGDAALDTIATLEPDRARKVPAARHGVLIVNPRSGDGKAGRADLTALARRRGIEVVELTPGTDLEQLAEDAVASGADVIGMAGGDGSQALVASVAARHGVPYVCVPAGTRNHLALDLGLDRDDLAGALKAFGACRERRIDLATVNGRVFVNNVSLGVYAKIVQAPEYREAKGATTATMLPELLGPESEGFDLAFTDDTGTEHSGAQLIQVSNNAYALRGGGFGTRPRLDRGVLGIAAVEVQGALDVGRFLALQAAGQLGRFQGWTEWTAPTFEVRSTAPIEAGVDGEALLLEPPLRFEMLPRAVAVRIPPGAPGVSPAARRQRSILTIFRGRPTTHALGGTDG
jgi:diacylglycerol kinase family enzyme